MNPQRPASRCFTASLCLLAVAASGSCARSTGGSNQVAPPPTGVTRQDLDEAVIEAVLVDLLAGTDEASKTLRAEQGPGNVLFSGVCGGRFGTLHQAVTSADSEKWTSMTAGDRRAATTAAAMITERMTKGQCFTAFRPKDARISLWEETPASTQTHDPGAPRPVRFAPPGYSDQNRLAVVVYTFAWSMHSGDAVYVVRYDGNTWRVISRHFLYYL